MVQLTLPKNSRITEGKTWARPTGARELREYRIYRFNPEDGHNQLKLLGAALVMLLPLPAAAAGDEPFHPLQFMSLYLLVGYLVLAFGYGFSAMRALHATVGALALALILMIGVWSAYGVHKAFTALFVAGTLVLLFAPMLGLGVYLGRRAGRRAAARKVLSTNGN